MAIASLSTVPRIQLPLVGLREEALIPGEVRSFAAPAVDAAALAALARAGVGTRLLVVTIASTVELPSLVAGRWGTECEIVGADGTTVALRGLGRARLVAARGKESPYQADVDVPAEDREPPDLAAMIASAQALLAAALAAAAPDLAGGADKLRAALLEVGRAVAGPEAMADLLQHPPAEALRRLAAALTARAPGERASWSLEQIARNAAASEPALPKAMRQRLWSQVVEIQRRLDVYDPAVPEEGDDVARLQRRLMQAGLPKVAREAAKRELRLLRSMQASHHDYATYLAHLDFMARLPWLPDPGREVDLDGVKAALDRGHFGLEKAKRRVLEHLAVRALGGENAAMILCLSGPPGVGKTSIARAMAEALGRPFVRVPLGGVHDEAEIRGHRISFTAASAGRILRGMAQSGSASALVLLDEIDKVGTDQQRSAMASLLEVLDPEQNAEFQDNYLGVPYDLSHALFVATANDVARIHPTLLDRMEPVEIEGYTVREKVALTRAHLLERLRAEHGLPAALAIDDDALTLLIEGHTQESGVRQLRRALAAIHRARALSLVRARAQGQADAAGAPAVSCAEVGEILGPPRFAVRAVDDALPVGVATGLSVGVGGGAILLVEVGLMPGKGGLSMTGSAGEVLQESVRAALAHLRVAPDRYGIDKDRLAAHDVHLHLPETGTPKDGPSAGAAIFAALVSALSGVALPADLALTGEISLTGRVLPVGGVRAKLLAAERAGVERVVLPADNGPDIPPDVAIETVLVRSLDEVFRAAFPAEGAREA